MRPVHFLHDDLLLARHRNDFTGRADEFALRDQQLLHVAPRLQRLADGIAADEQVAHLFLLWGGRRHRAFAIRTAFAAIRALPIRTAFAAIRALPIRAAFAAIRAAAIRTAVLLAVALRAQGLLVVAPIVARAAGLFRKLIVVCHNGFLSHSGGWSVSVKFL